MEEEVDISDLTLDQKVAVLMRDLPAPVQAFLKSTERNTISLQLAQKYKLHTDTAGTFERAYILMLLGVFTPDEFVQELREGGLDENTIRSLATDVNELVFKKLREEERTEKTPVPEASRPQVPIMQIGSREEIPPNLPGQIPSPEPIPSSIPAPADSQPAAPYIPPPVSAPQPAPQMPVFYAPAFVHPQYTQPPVYATPASYPPPQYVPIYSAPAPQVMPDTHPAARTMAADMERAAQGTPVNAPVPQQPAPMPQSQYIPPPTPVQPPAPMSQPSTISQPQDATPPTPQNYPPPPMATVRLTPVDRTHLNAPITKEYGSDPYREPIE